LLTEVGPLARASFHLHNFHDESNYIALSLIYLGERHHYLLLTVVKVKCRNTAVAAVCSAKGDVNFKNIPVKSTILLQEAAKRNHV
jgi:hypothetical protein